MFDYLFVFYAFEHDMTKSNQILHGTLLHSERNQYEVAGTEKVSEETVLWYQKSLPDNTGYLC